MITLAFLRQYARVLGVLAVVGAMLALYSWQLDKAEQRGYERATAEMAARVSKANAATAALEQRQRAQSDAASAAWETERNALQSKVDGLLARRPVVRVCKPAAARAAPVPSTADTAGRIDDAAGGRIDALQVGPDIGDRVVQLAGECERYREQLKALQDWVKPRWVEFDWRSPTGASR